MGRPKNPNSINGMKNQIKALKDQVEKLKSDRQVYRDFISNEFKNQLRNMTQKTYTPGEDLIKRMTQCLNKAESFYMWF